MSSTMVLKYEFSISANVKVYDKTKLDSILFRSKVESALRLHSIIHSIKQDNMNHTRTKLEGENQY